MINHCSIGVYRTINLHDRKRHYLRRTIHRKCSNLIAARLPTWRKLFEAMTVGIRIGGAKRRTVGGWVYEGT
jgi:hypothetical protein